MRHQDLYNGRSPVTESVNLTPLIDMVFILLIFFLVTASFTKESGIQVEQPTAQTSVRQEHASLVIGIARNGDIWIDGRRVELRSVRPQVERLQAQNPEGSVVIASDRAAEVALLIEVMDQVRLAGIDNVAIAAARPR